MKGITSVKHMKKHGGPYNKKCMGIVIISLEYPASHPQGPWCLLPHFLPVVSLSLSVTCLFASVVCCGSLVATLSWQWHFLCRSGGHCHQPQSCYGGEAGLLYPSFSVTCQPRRRPAKRPSLAWFPFPCLGPGCYPALHRGSVHHFKEGWGSLPSRAAPSRHIAIFALTDSQQVHGLGVDSVLSVWVECEGDCFLTYFRS